MIRIDRHGDRACKDVPASIEQVFQLLQRPQSKWTREMALVATIDRGHAKAMSELGAIPDEMQQIRAAERRFQKITFEEELSGNFAAE